MPDVQWIRSQFPVLDEYIYMNTGSVGPIPMMSAVRLQEEAGRELQEGRILPESFKRAQALENRLREQFADAFRATPEEIALTHLTTEGVNFALWSLDWQHDDELLISDQEHPAILAPAQVLAERFGVKVIQAPVTADDERTVMEFSQRLSGKTRMVAFSHVACNTGQRLPAERLVEMAKQANVLSLVDGAQSAGALPLDLGSLGADFYAIPGQKWLCGPEDTGALFVNRRCVAQSRQSFVGYHSGIFANGYMPHQDARRFEVGSRYKPALAALSTSLHFVCSQVGISFATQRIQTLAAYARQRLASEPGVNVITPARHAGLVSFTVADLDPEQAYLQLAEQKVVIRWIKQPRCLRASLGFFNTEVEVDSLAASLASLKQR